MTSEWQRTILKLVAPHIADDARGCMTGFELCESNRVIKETIYSDTFIIDALFVHENPEERLRNIIKPFTDEISLQMSNGNASFEILNDDKFGLGRFVFTPRI